MTAIPPGISHCALHDRMYPQAMLCPSCALDGTEEECTARVADPFDTAADLEKTISANVGSPHSVLIDRRASHRTWLVAARCQQCKRTATIEATDMVIEDSGFDVVAAVLSRSIIEGRIKGNAYCQCGMDPMERMVDGLSVRECLAAFQQAQREPTHHSQFVPAHLGGVHLTPAQRDAASSAWSTELKRKVEEGKSKGRVEVVCDDDRWEP